MNPRLRRWLQPRLAFLRRAGLDVLTIRYGDRLAEQFARFGPGSRIAAPQVAVTNPRAVAIGSDVEIRSHVCLETIGPKDKVLLEIGDGCILGHYVRLVAVNGITIAERCGIGHGCTIADTIHDWQQAAADTPPWDTPFILGAPLTIETGAWIGNNSVVIGGITVGARAIVAPNSVVTRDVPADTMVSGSPARRVPYPR